MAGEFLHRNNTSVHQYNKDTHILGEPYEPRSQRCRPKFRLIRPRAWKPAQLSRTTCTHASNRPQQNDHIRPKRAIVPLRTWTNVHHTYSKLDCCHLHNQLDRHSRSTKHQQSWSSTGRRRRQRPPPAVSARTCTTLQCPQRRKVIEDKGNKATTKGATPTKNCSLRTQKLFERTSLRNVMCRQ